jgi:hypothetical protein
MVNPIPPNHLNAVKNILTQKERSEVYCNNHINDPGIESNIISKFGIRYYNIGEIVNADIGEHEPNISIFPDILCESLIKDKTTVLRLEAGNLYVDMTCIYEYNLYTWNVRISMSTCQLFFLN